jgi:hypothetical protein
MVVGFTMTWAISAGLAFAEFSPADMRTLLAGGGARGWILRWGAQAVDGA